MYYLFILDNQLIKFILVENMFFFVFIKIFQHSLTDRIENLKK